MKRFLKYLLAVGAATASAQDVPRVTAAFSRDSIMIGDQVWLTVRVEKDLMQVVDFPALSGAFGGEGAGGGEVEVLSESATDTLSEDGRRQTLGKQYLLTVWREGTYNLGRFPALYLDKNRVDTLLAADSLRIAVATFDIDLEKDKPVGVKKIPWLFGEWSGWLLLGLAGLAVVAAAGWLIVRFRKKIPFLAPREILPPHVEAIRKLEALRHQKLPQNGHLKQYYSGLTDILREYISARWRLGAMEMTSAEIIDALTAAHDDGQIDPKRWADLRALLRTADMVKFAKHQPATDEAEADWYRAYYFVEETKLAIEGQAEESEQKL